MLFDFKETYASYDTAALVKIAHSSDSYQPEAVAAAKALLEERGISGEEQQNILHPAIIPVAPAQLDTDGSSNIFEELAYKPTEQTLRHLRIIYVLLCAYSIIIVFLRLKTAIEFYMVTGTSVPFFYLFINCLYASCSAFCAYSLYRKYKYAWSITFVFVVFSALPRIIQILQLLYTGVAYGVFSTAPYIHLFLYIGIFIAVFILLLQKGIKSFFNVSSVLQRYAVIIAGVLAIAHIIYLLGSPL